MSNKTYDVLKSLSTIWLPASATLVLTLGNIWNLPYTEAVAGTITALAMFIGTGIGISSKEYWESHSIEENPSPFEPSEPSVEEPSEPDPRPTPTEPEPTPEPTPEPEPAPEPPAEETPKRKWTPRTTRSGIEYGASKGKFYWNDKYNAGAVFVSSLGTYDLALPNCTCYAYARILESGDPAPVPYGFPNAKNWHSALINGWTYEKYDPKKCKRGDIVEWSGSRSHVAVVEYINEYGEVCISQSFYTDDKGTASGDRSPAVWGKTKQSVNDYGIRNYPNRYFIYSTDSYPYGGVKPTYILHNPNSK